MTIRLWRRFGVLAAGGVLTAVSALGVGAGAGTPGAQLTSAAMPPQLVALPRIPGVIAQAPDPYTYCTLPDGTPVDFYHCYTPQDIRAAYGVSGLTLAASVDRTTHNYGQGQTIVLVDAYGSPTAATDLQTFHNTFFPTLPDPNFQQIFPQGNPQFHNTSHGAGLSGSNGAAGWSGEATLDIEWAYSIAPLAHIILMAVPPAETEGVQGFPNLFKAIAGEIQAAPNGTVFSMSFSATEQTMEGAGPALVARLDQVFQMGLAKSDNFFAATGDTGTVNSSKLHKESASYPYPTVGWPASSPYVVAVGGTQLQYGWTWDPTSNTAFTSSGANGAYWNSTSTPGSNVQAVWNESWGPIATGGGASILYPRPSWQANVDPQYGNHRLVPDTSWNAAVNGGVDVYITAYPEYNCGNSVGCWSVYGGTSAATPQTAALVALLNADLASKGLPPVGFLDPLLYQLGASSSYSTAYTDIVPQDFGTASPTFSGSEVDVTGEVPKSVGNLEDNQLWEVPVPGYPTTTGYDATTGWGAPKAPGFISALEALSS